MDRISNLPPGIGETILCLMPIKDAGRTSVLSKEWRYKWTRIPKLVFNENAFQASGPEQRSYEQESQRKQMTKRCKLFYAIFQILLRHKGPIYEFTLEIFADDSCVEIDHILYHLSEKNTIKKLSINIPHGCATMPSSFISLTHLTDLYLSCCVFYHEPPFNRFAGLTSLYLRDCSTTDKTLLHLLSKSPSLRTVTLYMGTPDIILFGDPSMIDLFECLLVIETLTVWYGIFEVFCFEQGAQQKLPTALVHLKYFCVSYMCFFHDNDEIPVIVLIRSSPNLEKLTMKIDHQCCEHKETGCFTLEDYPDIWLEHLSELKIKNMSKRNKAELDFVKLLLAKSPVLKKVSISLYKGADGDGEMMEISQALSRSLRASPMVEITVEHHSKDKKRRLV